ncbi:hypothetical protein [Kamptonema formosum]|uniref:hypothetical protein n=1 Tax=Kamptonema formosum TaxID=331992 RepID=UPI00034801A6|nr:hypothetical protein [Oscillatoria sp. PCC 10802]
MVGTYGFYAIGGLYVVAPVIAWILLFYLGKKLWEQTDRTPEEERISIPLGVWVWAIAMLVMELALVMGHLDYNLGLPATIKSSIGWAKGWALMAIFPLIGCLPVRPQLIYRAACIVCYHTVLLAPIFILAQKLHLPPMLYVSPLRLVGGPGDEFFSFNLYELEPDSGAPRWRLFTPWAPAVGFVANIYFFFALQEKEKKWRWFGIAGSILMCLMSKSRLALLCLPVVACVTSLLSNLSQPVLLILMGLGSTFAGFAAPAILDGISVFWDKFKSARAASSRVRGELGKIAVARWESEAPVWGHGVVEKGPHLVEFMPIGSHHSWYGLLFVKGIVGLLALAVPMLWSFADLLVKAQNSAVARVGLSMVLILFLYTFGENLEILAYLFWPALVIMGVAFREKIPSRGLLR